MSETTPQEIRRAIHRVEHPAIATSLADLGMLRDIEIAPSGEITLTLVLPFPQIPENVRDHLIHSLGAAVQNAGGRLSRIRLAVMNEAEREKFLRKEKENWRG